MYLESELSHVNSRFNSYLETFQNNSLRKLISIIDNDERMSVIFIYTVLIHFYSGKLSNLDSGYSMWRFLFKIKVILIVYAFKKSIKEVLASIMIFIITIIIFQLMNFNSLFSYSTTYLFLLSILFIATKNIIQEGKLVIESQKGLDIENEINVFIGEESLEVMLSNDVAIGLINRYSSDVIYQLAYDNSTDIVELVYEADREILEFAQKMHLRKLIDNKGRSFQIAGLVSALNIAYSKIVESINENNYDNYSMKDLSLNALKAYNYGTQHEVVNKINDFIENLLKEGSFDIDYIQTIDIIESLIIILLCKDKLMELKERYKKFDNL